MSAGERQFHVDHATAEPLLQRLEGVQKQGTGWRARCPACGGRTRKLSIAERDGRILLHCFDCGDSGAVLAAVGLSWSDLHPPRHWPLSREEREAARRAMRAVAVGEAVDILAVEVAVAALASRRLQSWQALSVEDDQRLALACDRIGRAACVLTGKEQWRPDFCFPPARLVAIKRAAVEALRRELSTIEQELAEIDENLLRAELTPAQRAAAVARRKEIWEALHPETARNPRSSGGRGNVGFPEDTERSTGESKRRTQEHLSRANALGPDLHAVVGTSLDKGVELDALKDMEPDERKEAV